MSTPRRISILPGWPKPGSASGKSERWSQPLVFTGLTGRSHVTRGITIVLTLNFLSGFKRGDKSNRVTACKLDLLVKPAMLDMLETRWLWGKQKVLANRSDTTMQRRRSLTQFEPQRMDHWVNVQGHDMPLTIYCYSVHSLYGTYHFIALIGHDYRRLHM